MKIPFFRSVFTKMIFALSVSFLIIISISFLYIYGLYEGKDGFGKNTEFQPAGTQY